jgi:septal ring factor EnvC (AmiA/AmiB activator)
LIQHANGYVTTYNHMSRFGRGVSAGARVRQGQVVGYVGHSAFITVPLPAATIGVPMPTDQSTPVCSLA